MPFDPDAYLASKAQAKPAPTGFDPDKYLASKMPQAQPQAPSQLQTGIEQFGQGAAQGYLPQLQALATKGMEAVTPESDVDKQLRSQGFNIQPGSKSYTQLRDENIARLEQEQKAYPKTAIAGQLGGIIASAPAFAKALPQVEAGAGALTRMGAAGAAGALQGGLQNPGDVQGEVNPIQPVERLKNARTGALFGAAAEGVTGLLRGAGQKLKQMAQERAFKQTGAMLKDFRAAYGKDQVGEIGQTLLDKGLVSTGDTFDDVASKTAALKEETGKKIGDIYDQLKGKATNFSQELLSKNPELSKEFTAAELSQAVSDPKIMPKIGQEKYTEQMNSIIGDIATKGDMHDPRYLNDVIGELDNRINWAKRVPDMSDVQQGLVALRRTLRGKVNTLADAISQVAGEGPASEQIKDLNKLYGVATQANKMAEDRVARESANRFFSPSDYGMAGVGALGGMAFGNTPEERLRHGAEGAALGLLNKYGRKYGPGIVATGANVAGKAISAIPGQLPGPVTTGLIGGQLSRMKK